MKNFLPPNVSLEFIEEACVVSPFFDINREKKHFEILNQEFDVMKTFQGPGKYYKEKYLEPYSLNVCANSKNKTVCCKNNFPQNDFAYYSCVNSVNWSQTKKNYKFEIIFFVLINIVILTCCITPKTDLYKQL